MNPEYHNHPNGFSYATNMLLNDLVIDKNNVMFYIEEYLSPSDIEYLKNFIHMLISEGVCHPLNSDFSDKYIDLDISRIDSNDVESEMRLQSLIVYRKIIRYTVNCDNLHVLLDKLFALERKQKRAEDRLLRKNRNGKYSQARGAKSIFKTFIDPKSINKTSDDIFNECVEILKTYDHTRMKLTSESKDLKVLIWHIVRHINTQCEDFNSILYSVSKIYQKIISDSDYDDDVFQGLTDMNISFNTKTYLMPMNINIHDNQDVKEMIPGERRNRQYDDNSTESILIDTSSNTRMTRYFNSIKNLENIDDVSDIHKIKKFVNLLKYLTVNDLISLLEIIANIIITLDAADKYQVQFRTPLKKNLY